jgi:hypothetical protein
MTKDIRLDTLKKQPYDNCKVLNKDGELIFRCNKKRINWYLNRNLATLISEDIIQLNFETKGQGNLGDEFYLQNKHNLCVICGCADHLTMHHIIPRCYRRHFPSFLKSKSSFDIVVLCKRCHNAYEKVASEFKKVIADEYGCPVEGTGLVIDLDLREIRKSASAIKMYGDTMPPEKRERFVKIIEKHLGRAFTEEDIDKLSKLEFNNRDNYLYHGQYVIARVEDLEEFVKRWRKHFLEKMKPQFMLENWDENRTIWPKTFNGEKVTPYKNFSLQK